jgi:hypothetical protein
MHGRWEGERGHWLTICLIPLEFYGCAFTYQMGDALLPPSLRLRLRSPSPSSLSSGRLSKSLPFILKIHLAPSILRFHGLVSDMRSRFLFLSPQRRSASIRRSRQGLRCVYISSSRSSELSSRNLFDRFT